MSPRSLFCASVIALALLPFGALAVRADDGRPPAPEVGRPPTYLPIPITQLRPSDLHVAPIPSSTPDPGQLPVPARATSGKKELVIFVGGYASQADDSAFDLLKARFPPEHYDVRRFGQDPRFPFDTYGSIATSARVLTAQIRDAGPSYSGVSIVSHSMGGVVADRAFADGLSASDGVRTYVAIAAPHSGADYARVPTVVLPLISPVKDIVRTAAVVIARDPESPAVRDLATASPPRPPRGVARLDISLATDGFVNEFDARDPGVEQRLFLPSSPWELFDGHGGSLVNREIADLVVDTVRAHRVPPDRRDPVTRMVAPIIWDRETWLWRTILCFATLSAIALYTVRLLPVCRRGVDELNALCGRLLHSIGR